MNEPLVSIIIPAYNSEQYVAAAIDSVLAQDYPNIEIVVIEDGSKDGTLGILQKYSANQKILLLKHPNGENKGVSKTRKLGLSAAKGDYIAFLDADDQFIKNKIRTQLQAFFANPEVILVHSSATLLNETGFDYHNSFEFHLHNIPYFAQEQNHWLSANPICNSTVMVKKTALLDVEFGFPQVFQFEDWLTWTLLAFKGKFYYIHQPLIIYRLHANSATANILKNNLITQYSTIEYLTTLFHALQEQEIAIRNQIVPKLKEAIITLYGAYNPSESTATFSKSFLEINDSNEQQYYQNEYIKLKDRYDNLEKSYNRLAYLKENILVRIINKFFNESNFRNFRQL